MWQSLTVADVMQPVAKAGGEPWWAIDRRMHPELAGGAGTVVGARRHRD